MKVKMCLICVLACLMFTGVGMSDTVVSANWAANTSWFDAGNWVSWGPTNQNAQFVPTAADVALVQDFGSGGHIDVDAGAASVADLLVGNDGTGSIAVASGQSLTSASSVNIGAAATGVGSVQVDGTMSSNLLMAGNLGNGDLTVNNGGVVNVNADWAMSGYQGGSTGNITVNTGGQLNVTGILYDGFLGNGGVNVNGGTAAVSSLTLVAAASAANTGDLTVGNSGQLSTLGLSIGEVGAGTATLSSGSISTTAWTMVGGNSTTGSGSLVVDGGTMNVGDILYVGFDGSQGDVTLNNGVINVSAVLAMGGFSGSGNASLADASMVINGGTLTAGGVDLNGAGAADIVLNGGTLIDTNYFALKAGNTITINGDAEFIFDGGLYTYADVDYIVNVLGGWIFETGPSITDNGDGTITVANIPEPATMALLGLGSLLIRRKR